MSLTRFVPHTLIVASIVAASLVIVAPTTCAPRAGEPMASAPKPQKKKLPREWVWKVKARSYDQMFRSAM
ncbi:MAG: hypothetical protein RMA76_33895 [Deltaproteobacteria bacterium]